MDDIVRQAMARWPGVPSVYGWLSLDRRGNWRIKGEPIAHPLVTEFICRNYAQDAGGRWYFQNGPQRVFVTLEYAPLVYRLAAGSGAELVAHIGPKAHSLLGSWLDEDGTLLLFTDLGIGLLDDRDLGAFAIHLADVHGHSPDEDEMAAAIERLHAGESAGLAVRWHDTLVPLEPIRSSEVAGRFGFVREPVAPPGEEACA